MNRTSTTSNEVTPGQKETGIRLAKDATQEAMWVAIDQLRDDGEITREEFQRFLGKGNRLKSRLIPFLKKTIKELSEVVRGCLKRISGDEEILLDPTTGTETIAKAKDTFVYIDSDFRNWGTDVPGADTQAAKVEVYELIENATFEKMFKGFNAELDSLCFTQGQIVQFVEKHPNWLRDGGYATFFLFKVGSAFFVASVDRDDDGRLYVHVHRLSYGVVWNAENRHRVVVPQLALEN